jgi:IS4 transposase
VNADATTGLTITDADVHETNSFERLVTQSMRACGSTKLIFVMDKGYYDHIRFQLLYDAGIFFVTPRKKYSLNKAELYPSEDTEKIVDEKRIVDGYIKLNGMKNRLRWIRVYDEDKEEPFELLTDIIGLPAEIILALYGERWAIEVLFKDVKQHFGLKQPIGRTLNALLFHIYAVFIAYLLLQILRYQFGGKYLSMSLLKFQRALKYADEVADLFSKDSALFS